MMKNTVVLIISVIVILAYFAWLFFGMQFVEHYWGTKKFDLSEWGQFGDGFGTINSLISALTLIGVAFGVSFQHQELKTAKDQADTAKKEAEVERTSREVENHFFQMMDMLSKIVEQVYDERQNNKTTGKEAIFTFIKMGSVSFDIDEAKSTPKSTLGQELEKLYKNKTNKKEIHISLNGQKRSLEDESDKHDRNEYDKIAHAEYRKIHEFKEHCVGHYLRFIYRIIKYIDDSSLNQEKKDEYVKILRAQLSKYEQILIFLNSFEFIKFKYYIIKYQLFDNIDLGMFTGKFDESKKDINKYEKPYFIPLLEFFADHDGNGEPKHCYRAYGGQAEKVHQLIQQYKQHTKEA